ncbi:MAG: hypothetical protein JST83_15295 [Bacteroidetes bacterium]|nr:hypothetical protein [Bacteroidota bacterium]
MNKQTCIVGKPLRRMGLRETIAYCGNLFSASVKPNFVSGFFIPFTIHIRAENIIEKRILKSARKRTLE